MCLERYALLYFGVKAVIKELLSVILRDLNKGQKKEIYFWNKAKIFSSFLLILMHVLHHAR